MEGFDDYPVCWPTEAQVEKVLVAHKRLFGLDVPAGKHIVARYCAALPAISARTGMAPDMEQGPATTDDVLSWDNVFGDTPDADLMLVK